MLRTGLEIQHYGVKVHKEMMTCMIWAPRELIEQQGAIRSSVKTYVTILPQWKLLARPGCTFPQQPLRRTRLGER